MTRLSLRTHKRFWLLARIGIAGTAISIHSSKNTRELIIGFSNTSIGCYNLDTRKPIAKILKAHKFPIRHISVDPSSSLALLTTFSDATIWDRQNWSRKRVLVSNSVGVQKASFSATGKYIYVIHNDGAITLWNSQNFECIWEYCQPTTPGEEANPGGNIAFNHEDGLFVYGTDSLTVMDMKSQESLGQCNHECFQCGIIDMKFVGSSKKILVLNSKGILYSLDIERLDQVQQLDIDFKVGRMPISIPAFNDY
ncbi:WD40 repeat-like protein [Basidiobolus meristosporus CBS 931.73]|uniref:WD40 repeat-like protein n=1 Tax=Basidiobolus meristosporus CBS 931.73 TaxID=1314790 RepID=A0A1Y1YB10_9FUNG|nr:WD40 repeat-like protein [Basidiobolus meristosporus CBS 931.73]|eukprot:ORX95168.1 WD40 repeat-like protein [Basidiobolus meristosporus CBS 931.73]